MGRKIIFLDRDGIINVERGVYTWKKEDFIILKDTVKGLLILQERGYGFIIITNQSGISKGLYGLNDFYEITRYMVDEFNKQGIVLTDVYMCPHHPEQTRCLCRKPQSLLIERAIARYDIDITNSFLVGDNDRDVQAGTSAGIKSIKMESNSSFLSILGQIL